MSQIPDIDRFASDDYLTEDAPFAGRDLQEHSPDYVSPEKRASAIRITQQIRESLNTTSDLLLTVMEQKIYKALNYKTFEQYCKAEFNISRQQGYYIVRAERLNRRLTAHFVYHGRQNAETETAENVNHGLHSGAFQHRVKLNERCARELLRLHNEEDQIRAYTLACERSIARPKPTGIQASFWKPGKITSSDIKEAVRKVQGEALSAENERFPVIPLTGNDAISIIGKRGNVTTSTAESKSTVPNEQQGTEDESIPVFENVSYSLCPITGDYLLQMKKSGKKAAEAWLLGGEVLKMAEAIKKRMEKQREGKPHGEG